MFFKDYFKWINTYKELSEKREVFLVGEITDETAKSLIAKLLYIDSIDNKEPIRLYIDSPGGLVTAGLSICDTIQYVKSDVITICNRKSSGIATLILSSGKKGFRFCLENAEISLCEISKDIRATNKDNQEIKRIEYGIYKILSSKLDQTIGRIKEDSKYWSDKGDHFLTSNEAIAYGIVDKVFQE